MIGLTLFLLLVAVPIAELYVIVQVGQELGVLSTLAVMFLMSAAGAILLRHQGMATWRRLQETLRLGRVPASEAVDGALILLGGALLLTPGFLTDIVGLVLLLPPTRVLVKGGARRVLGTWARRRVDAGYVRSRDLD